MPPQTDAEREQIERQNAENRAEWLADALEILRDPNATELVEWRTPFVAENFQAMAEALPASTIRKLEIGREECKDEGAVPIINVLPETQIESLAFRQSGISNQSLAALKKVLPKTKITDLTVDLFYATTNKVNGEAVEKFLDVLPQTDITKFEIGGNWSAETLAKLQEVLPKTKITELKLNRVFNLDDAGSGASIPVIIRQWERLTQFGKAWRKQRNRF